MKSVALTSRRKITRTPADSLLLGKMTRGCRLCVRGAKLVLFVTGICRCGCFYCPLSEKRRGRDLSYANERPIRIADDIINEARSFDALGTGITGGDPIIKFRRVLGYIRYLKGKFGKRHHIHMYCCSELSKAQLQALKREGLDEIRFHTKSTEPVKSALEIGLYTGVEIPVLPDSYRRIASFLAKLDKISCDFVNLNELEFSDTNSVELRKRGFRVKSRDSAAVGGSQKEAIKILKWAARNTHLNIHYCPSSLKDSVQLRNRLKRKVKNVASPHEAFTNDGLLIKGIILDLPAGKLRPVRSNIIQSYGIPRDLIVINLQKKRIEIHWRVAKKLSEVEPKLKFALVEEYPTYDRLETTLIPL